MTLLDDIFDTGERMRSALESERLDDYLDLLTQRGTLLDTFNEFEHPSQIDAEWHSIAAKLAEQHELLMQAASEYEERMRESLVRLERTKGAARSYHAVPARKHILNENLRI
jgi:hypothetical protein